MIAMQPSHVRDGAEPGGRGHHDRVSTFGLAPNEPRSPKRITDQ